MDEPDTAIVYFSPETITQKKLKPITKDQVISSFGRKDLLVFTDSNTLEEYLKSIDWKNRNLLMMSSGNFNGLSIESII